MDGAPRVLPPFRRPVGEGATLACETRVEVHTGVVVKDIDKEGLTIQTHEGTNRLKPELSFGLGRDSAGLGKNPGEPPKAGTDGSGRIKVGPQLTVAITRIFTLSEISLAHWIGTERHCRALRKSHAKGTYAAKAILGAYRETEAGGLQVFR